MDKYDLLQSAAEYLNYEKNPEILCFLSAAFPENIQLTRTIVLAKVGSRNETIPI